MFNGRINKLKLLYQRMLLSGSRTFSGDACHFRYFKEDVSTRGKSSDFQLLSWVVEKTEARMPSNQTIYVLPVRHALRGGPGCSSLSMFLHGYPRPA